jgi:hypothetical protein
MSLSISGNSGVSFVDGQIIAGFGSSDIVVKKVWLANRSLLRLNVSVSPLAQAGPVTLTVISGLQLETLTATLQVQSYSSLTASLVAPVTDSVSGLPGVAVGHTAVIGTNGLPSNLAGWTLTIGGSTAPFTLSSTNQLRAQVPPGASIGLALVQLIAPAGITSPPSILMQIDGPPPVINAVLNAAGLNVDAAHAAQPGDSITLSVAGLPGTFQQSQLRIAVGGVPQVVQSVIPGGGGTFLMTFVLSPQVASGSPQVTVGIDTQVSQGKTISVRASDTSAE